MTISRIILAIVILLFAVYIVVMNWGCVIVSIRNRKRGIDRHHSTVPVVSFIMAGLAHLICPWPDKSWMIAIPLLDIANWSLLWLPFGLIREWRRRKIAEPGCLCGKRAPGAGPGGSPPRRDGRACGPPPRGNA